MSTVLLTDRLVIRHFEQRDLDSLFAMVSDPEVMRYYPETKDRAGAQAWLDWVFEHYARYGYGLFAIEHIETGVFLGQTGIIYQEWDGRPDLEVGYMYTRPAWGHGYATEAARACKNYAFARYHPDRVVSFIRPDNIPSQNVAKRNGMRILKQVKHPRTGQIHDIWGIFAGDAA